tara:strand:+ start:288 stop:704 length:417 start_codon:yes stop_codon:yes gene_type:complete
VKLYNTYGRLVSKNVQKYRLKWEGKCRSNIQFKVKQFFKPYWMNHICYEEFPVYGTRMKVDMINMTKRIAVEVQGAQHESFNKFFHGNSRAKYLASIKRDYEKRIWLENNNFKVLEIREEDLASLSRGYILEKFEVNI